MQRELHPQEQLLATDVTAKRPANGTKGAKLDMLNLCPVVLPCLPRFGTCVCNNVCPLYATRTPPSRTALRHGRGRQKPHERLNTPYYDSVLLCVVSFRWFCAVRSMCAQTSPPRVQTCRRPLFVHEPSRHKPRSEATRAIIHGNRQRDRAQKPVNTSRNIKMESQSIRKRKLGSTMDHSPGKARSDHKNTVRNPKAQYTYV
jgi:hypothetical protein